ncbi:MAG: rRNA pseudouridine synthase [Alphaproteobacteria bacterium]|nr:rRNA pseudouridine synthase [Alphaproteobacteria bacterium]
MTDKKPLNPYQKRREKNLQAAASGAAPVKRLIRKASGEEEMWAPERIAKRLARAGLCSRREAEAWIAAGRVKVDGKVITSPALNVTDANLIHVDGKPIAAKEATRLWLYHKPKGLVTTHKDPESRPTVFDALPKEMGRVISIGRLDLTSEGLLLLTNDGELARHLELPSTGWTRRYRVRVFGTPDAKSLEKLARGMTVEGISYGSIEAKVEQGDKSNAWLAVSLQEGKNREIRKVFEALGHKVSRLIRVAYGPFQLGKLPSGEVKEIVGSVLRSQLGNWKA